MRKLVVVFLILAISFSFPPAVKSQSFECPTPKSIMLHSWYGVEGTEKLAQSIIKNGWVTFTYRQVYEHWDRGQCVSINVLLISLDDFYSETDCRDLFAMADVFVKYGLVMTLGVVTRPAPFHGAPTLWEKLKAYQDLGFEVASHSVYHGNALMLDDQTLEKELRLSFEIICEHLGTCPETYILPYGVGWDYRPLLEIARKYYKSVVSISAPRCYSGDLFVMKRISPGSYSTKRLFEILEERFSWFASVDSSKTPSCKLCDLPASFKR